MLPLSIDFETHSTVDLTTDGAYKYAMHPSTGVYVMSYAYPGEEPDHWAPGDGDPFPDKVADHIEAGGIITAWNAQFERLIFWYVVCPDYDVPEPAIEQFQCTAARARAHGLPGKLGDCARAMAMQQLKMEEGARLIRDYCAKNVPWEQIPPEDQDLMIDYCDQDVRTERTIAIPLRELTDREWHEYHINEKICDRGVPLDMAFVREACVYADDIRNAADGKIEELTGGHVKTARQRKSRDEWLLPQLNEEQLTVITVGNVKTQKVKYSFTETHRNELLADPDLAEPVRQYLELVNEAGGASLRKYQGMKHRAVDSHLHGALIFNGAGQTGRFSSTGLQVHNLKRADLEDPDQLVADVIDGWELEDESKTLAQLVRSAIYNKSGLSWCDWSNIEGRVAPWLADTPAGEAKLDVFRRGEDPYINNAVQLYHTQYDAVTKDQRANGKVMELALGFLGGVGALKMMGINYGMKFTTPEAEQMRDAWRAQNPWAIAFGDDLNITAMNAMQYPGQWHEVGRVAYAFDGGDWLWCRLPCGRLLAYFKPRLEWGETPWGEEQLELSCVWGAAKPKKGQKWPRRRMHRGLWLENITQATAGSLLRRSIELCDMAGLPVILHVHDEIICLGDQYLEPLLEIMMDPPLWAGGLPIEAEGDTGPRYGK